MDRKHLFILIVLSILLNLGVFSSSLEKSAGCKSLTRVVYLIRRLKLTFYIKKSSQGGYTSKKPCAIIRKS